MAVATGFLAISDEKLRMRMRRDSVCENAELNVWHKIKDRTQLQDQGALKR
jgi:hypothetical protein